MSWILKYKVVRIVPGVVVAPWGEHIDLSNPSISEDKIKRLHESGCPYLQPIEPKVVVQEKKPELPSTEKNPITNTKPGYKPAHKK